MTKNMLRRSNLKRLCSKKKRLRCKKKRLDLKRKKTNWKLRTIALSRKYFKRAKQGSWLLNSPVAVGHEQQIFNVHIEKICAASTYFRDLLSSSTADGAIEKPKETVILNDAVDNVNAFEMFLQFCYLNTYLDNKIDKAHLLLLHARVYVLAEKLKCSPLKKLALRKATDWYRGYSMHTDGDILSQILPDVLDAISAVYTHTVDTNSGCSVDSSLSETTRDVFRLLLAHFAAADLVRLRTERRFVDIHHSFPDFNTDMLLFMNNAPKAPDPPIVLLFGADTFTVYVGEDAKRYIVHTAAIECSAYFKKLLASDMKEALEKTVQLDTEVDTADAFDAFVQYCYFRDYVTDDDRADTLTCHARAYSLADRLSCPGLKELALQKAKQLCSAGYSDEVLIAVPAAVALIYEHSYDAQAGKNPEIPDDAQDFATDVMLLATDGGEMEVDGDGQLKLESNDEH
ncbi:hypothetical protein ABW21_db0208414 [Orbilia brochopaga]|nr:hypothetical protein ABW21_db0208414 [Drechslerella brochopaga]